MTLQKIYDITGIRFKMRLLAGKEGMEREVSRLYYFEDLMISDWTRDGELLITTAMMTTRDPEWILKFVKSVQSFHPCGILVNTGGYLEQVPQSVIDYCESIKLPLLSFPWEIVLQDIMTEITNLIYVTEQRENNIAQAFRNLIFNREDSSGYAACFAKNGLNQYDKYIVVSCNLLSDETKRRHYLGLLREVWDKSTIVEMEKECLLVFYGLSENVLREKLEQTRAHMTGLYPKEKICFYIGSEENDYINTWNSFQKALLCRKIGEKQDKPVLAFYELGALGVIAVAERPVLQKFCSQNLRMLREYDRANDTEYVSTLDMFLKNHCNAGIVAEKMFIHRNTVNYRLRKIGEITGEDLSDIEVLLNYKMAFLGELVL